MLTLLLTLLVVASWIYWVVAWWMVRAFFRAAPRDGEFMPPVSILKPCRGLDVEAYENLASFCRQDYPVYEMLVGVADAADPVIPLVHRLQQEFPDRPIRWFVAPPLGVNPKVGIMHYLAAQARHDVLVISDSDMRVTPDYLRRVVAPLADPSTGLVTCAYRAGQALTFTARLEALHMGVTFLPSVVVARGFLNMRFAMGATVALRRSDLERIGGFAALADCLADDHELGVRIADLGLQNQLSDYVTVSVLGATTFREQWNREVRWARCNRVSQPREYPGLILTFSTPLSVLLVLAAGFAPPAWLVLMGSLLLRWLVGWLITNYTGDHVARRWLIWLPVRDLLSAAVWCAGAVGRRVVWRGETYELRDGGLMQLASANRAWRSRLSHWLIRSKAD